MAYLRVRVLELVGLSLVAALVTMWVLPWFPKPSKALKSVLPAWPDSAVTVQTGSLKFGQYFTPRELQSIGFTPRGFEQVGYRADLDLRALSSGGLNPDTIPSIDEPHFLSAKEANAWLSDERLVLGLRFEQEARAYPISILNWHEIVNDRFGQVGVVVTYCPLCDSGVVFLAPKFEGQPVQFGTSGRLYHSDLVMYDRASATLWSQIEGKAIVGPLVGKTPPLQRLPADIVPYGLWKQSFPNTRVLDRPRAGQRLGNRIIPHGYLSDEMIQSILDSDPSALAKANLEEAEDYVRNYGVDPYAFYRMVNPKKGTQTRFGVTIQDDRLPAKTPVIAFCLGGVAKAYARQTLLKQKIVHDEVDHTPLLLVVSPAAEVKVFERRLAQTEFSFKRTDTALIDQHGDRWNFDGVAQSGPWAGQKLPAVAALNVYWFAWHALYPASQLYLDQSP